MVGKGLENMGMKRQEAGVRAEGSGRQWRGQGLESKNRDML